MGALTIKMALGLLDPADDEQWTSDGLPRMDAIEKMVEDRSIIRKDITDTDPEFCREIAAQRQSAALPGPVTPEEPKDDQTTQVQVGIETQTQEVNPEEVLKDHILALSQEIENLAVEETEIGKQKDVLIKHLRQLQQETNQQHSATADTVARMAFIKSQSQQRAKRHEKGRKIMAIIGKDGLNPQSRLDQAMRRKTARGTRRPPPRTPKQ